MNKIILYTGIGVLLAVNVALTYKVSSLKKDSEPNNTNETLLKLNKSYYINNIVNSQLNNNIKLKGDIVLTDTAGATSTLSELAKSGLKMVVRSTEDGCGMCIENELALIKKYAKIIGGENIVIITTHSNTRKLAIFKQSNNIPFKLFACHDLGIPYEKEANKPFIFTLDTDLNACNFFIPEVTQTDVSKNYYSAIFERYYNPALKK